MMYNLCVMRAGKYIQQLSGGMQYKAFKPNPLPFEIRIDEKTHKLLSEADLAIGRLDSVSTMVPDLDFFILMYVRKEATLSSQVEGTRATFSDVLKAESHINGNEIHSDVDEILNYIDAMNYGLSRLSELPLSLRLIKEIHLKLLKGVRGHGKTPGEFRRTQNWIGGATINSARYIPPTPHDMLPLLDNLEKFIHDQSPLPVLLKAALIHSQFEAIHPFLDGNGRIGRLLITFYLCQQGILKNPLLYISDYLNQNRLIYYDRLQAIPQKDDIEGWIYFLLEGIQITATQALATVQKIIKLKAKDTEQVMLLGKQRKSALTLLNGLYRRPLLQIRDIEAISNLSNSNAINLANKMVQLGILKEISGRKRNRIYQYEEYIKIFDVLD